MGVKGRIEGEGDGERERKREEPTPRVFWPTSNRRHVSSSITSWSASLSGAVGDALQIPSWKTME